MLQYRPLPLIQQLDDLRKEDPEKAQEQARASMRDCAARPGFQWVLYYMREIEAAALGALNGPGNNSAFFAGMLRAMAQLRAFLVKAAAEPETQEAFELHEPGLYPELPPEDEPSAPDSESFGPQPVD